MHNNYYFLRQLSRQLKKELKGFRIGEIFSQAKNELVISLYTEKEERFIKAHLDPSFCCLSFPEVFNRARRNSVDLFNQIIGREIVDIIQIDQDRSFYLKFHDKFLLLFKMHSNRSNVVLIHKEKIIEVFKNNLKQDFQIQINNLSNHISTDRASFENAGGKYKKLIPTFGKSFDLYFENKNYDQLELEEQYKCLITLLEYLNAPVFIIHYGEGGLPKLNLFELNSTDLRYQEPIETLNAFYKRYISSFRLEKEKSILRNSLGKQIKKSESYISKSSLKLEKLLSASNYKNIGDLIMANLHIIKPHSTEIEINDFYTQKPVKIHLKSMLSPQLNAEKYYKKAKNQRIEIDTIKKNIESRKVRVTELKKQIDDLGQISELKHLGKKTKIKSKQTERPYQIVHFMDYEILIGKNAVKNEKLTFQIAGKEDLFLHAKDTSGSHVVIKRKSNQNFPKKVIEKAASFAAFYSKNKSETLCRVLYTPKKYVRKAKGAPAGTVIVEREKVILAKPVKNEV